MKAEYYKQSMKCFNNLYCLSSCSQRCGNYVYSPYYEYYRNQEIIVKKPSSVNSVIYTSNTTTVEATYTQADKASMIYEGSINSDEVQKVNLGQSESMKEGSYKIASDEYQNKRLNDEDGLYGRGLFHYSKWWDRREVDIFVNGDILTGIPIFTDENTLRVVNDFYSYFIPLEKIDYIRTSDGLKQ